MRAIPGRADFAALTEAARAIGPTVMLGFADTLDDGRVRVLYSYPYGVGAYVLPAAEAPAILRPAADGIREGAVAVEGNPQGAIEWHLLFGGVRRVVARRVAELLLDRLC